MKSQENKIDKLEFHWDHKAAKTLRTKQMDRDNANDFERYLDWLDEVKPSRRELRKTKIFNKPFTLTS